MLMPTPPSLINDALKALSHPSRILILRELSRAPMTVNELCDALPEFAQPTISKHLAALRVLGIVSFAAQGVLHTYSVDKNALTICAEFIRDIANGGVA
jgi:DNA-binding transcriptional ArsR family regulator